MEKLIKKVWNWLRRDGLLHLETCALIAVLFGLFLPWWSSVIPAVIAGVGKELWDKKHGVCDKRDVICDMIGAVLGMVIVLLFRI